MNTGTWAASLTALALLAGCASRSVPSSFPEASPASLSAPEARRVQVTTALDEDPPLPGAPTEGGSGLQPTGDTAQAGHEHHHGPTDQSTAEGHNTPAARPTGAPDAGQLSPAVGYVCPMHPDVVSDREGRCSRCGMALERRP